MKRKFVVWFCVLAVALAVLAPTQSVRATGRSLKASATARGVLGVRLPEGSKLVSKSPQTTEKDAIESYRIAATNDEIIAFFDRELLGSGWRSWGYTGSPDWRAYQKPNRLISIATGKSGAFTIMGGTR